MTMHRKPLTPLEESGLRAHGLDIGTPSQLSDVFRQGVAWAIQNEQQTVKWGIDWGFKGDRACASIMKQHPDGVIEVIACEYAPADFARHVPREHDFDRRVVYDRLVGLKQALANKDELVADTILDDTLRMLAEQEKGNG